jgi:hypothetical protein
MNPHAQQEDRENLMTADDPTDFEMKIACLDDCDLPRGRQVPPTSVPACFRDMAKESPLAEA